MNFLTPTSSATSRLEPVFFFAGSPESTRWENGLHPLSRDTVVILKSGDLIHIESTQPANIGGVRTVMRVRTRFAAFN